MAEEKAEKAEKTAPSGGWADLIHYAVINFLLLRDLFGYLLAGAVFAFIAIASGRLDPWMNYIDRWPVLLGFSYVAGHLGAAIGYYVQDRVGGVKKPESPPQRTAEALYLRRLYPRLFVEVDRRDTVALLRTAVGGNLLAASCLLLVARLIKGGFAPPPISLIVLLFVFSLIFLRSGFTGRKHVNTYLAATLEAAEWAAEADGVHPRVNP